MFTQETDDKQFCAIGSAKSNIGHCESAAGIAGVTKVLLQMKYRQLAPSLHSNVLNPNIDFLNSPFKVQQELEEWKRPIISVNGKDIELPRIAGVSSFGAGGVNAHILIEEYAPEPVEERLPARKQPAVIVLSAKNEERLQKRAERLLHAIREQTYVEADLHRIAYTLQVGREAMKERLAFVAETMQELEEKLYECISGTENREYVYRGQVKSNKEAIAAFAADEDMSKTIEAWLQKGKYAKVLDLWVRGLRIDWSTLYQDQKPRRISLPAYPFARDRYWIDVNAKAEEKRTEEPFAPVQPVIPKPSVDREASGKPANITLQPLMTNQDRLERVPSDTETETITAEALCDELTAGLAEVLYMDQNEIDPDEAFIDIGMDSITGLEWIKAINKQYGTSLNVTKVYDYPTTRDFAVYLAHELSTQAGEKKQTETYTPIRQKQWYLLLNRLIYLCSR